MESLIITTPAPATQPPRVVSAPGGQLPVTGDIYDQGQDLGKRREREEGEAIDRDEETESVRSRGVELQSDPRHYENDQDIIPRIHQVCNEERNDKNHLQDTQAEEHRDEAEIPTADKEGEGGNAEGENQAEEMETLCRVTQREESVDDQGRGNESAPDVSDDLKPEISGVLAKDAHLIEEVERSDEETGVMDVKTGEDKQSEEEENSFTNYPEERARGNIEEILRGTQEAGQDNVLQPVSEDEQRDEGGETIDDKEGKTEAGERGIGTVMGRRNHDLFSSEIQERGRDGGSKQSMPKHDHQRGVEGMDVQEVVERKKGNDKHAQRTDTSVTERYPSEGVQAQDSDNVRRGDVSVHPEQKKQKDVELAKKGRTGVNDRGMGSRPAKLLTKHSSEIQDDRRADDNKQKVPKVDQRCKEGGGSRRKGHEQERGVRRDVKGVTEQNRGDSGQPHFGQNVEDQSFDELDDRQRMTEQKTSGTYPSRKDDGVETQSKHIQNRSHFSLKRAGSAESSKPAANQGAGRGKKVRRSNSQERPGSKSVEVMMIGGEIRSGTLPKSLVISDLRREGSARSSKPAECQGAGCGEQVRRSNTQLEPTLEFAESTSEERPGSKNIEMKTPDTEICSETGAGNSVWGSLSKRFANLKVSMSSPTKPKKRASKKSVGNAQEEESNSRIRSKATSKQKLPDTEDQEKKKGSWCCKEKGKKKRREKEKKQKTTTWCFPKRQKNDSD